MVNQGWSTRDDQPNDPLNRPPFLPGQFYRRLVAHKEATTTRGVRELDDLAFTLLKLEDEKFQASNENHKLSRNDITQVRFVRQCRHVGELLQQGGHR